MTPWSEGLARAMARTVAVSCSPRVFGCRSSGHGNDLRGATPAHERAGGAPQHALHGPGVEGLARRGLLRPSRTAPPGRANRPPVTEVALAEIRALLPHRAGGLFRGWVRRRV